MASDCWSLPETLCRFPAMEAKTLRLMRKTIDDGFRDIVRSWADTIDAATVPLQMFLNALERAFAGSPWVLVLAVLLAAVWATSRSWKIVLGTAIALCLIGWVGLWQDTMVTLAMVSFCTVVAVIIGLPIGIAAARSDRLQRIVSPVLDVMQTLPSFVYLIPVVVIFGIGKVPGMIAVVIYAVPPMIRLTNLGIRLVDREVTEAAEAFGSSARQKLWNVQLPLALPTIMTGVNQTIMMSLSMVVVASMVGVGGLGKNVLQAINNQFFTVGFLNGFALVAIAIVFDRSSQAFGLRLQKHREAGHD
ncbi:ABC transporter permease [Rhodobacter veldkampii DSM 11550]|uniref:ABC transporter permease n=1 Tax=Phaeovulum veldkampii DSM 11550 TaxID=1185920 RepID=A0A2T4JA12_9RHOB|nr:proline/glycine betaine ABC transporter permease [Phaeovulum veldkampii]MBK5946005.1 ABC transporter permease [Phaeovulum veldkampii DSM 11550]NCU19781.1 proline/glycine betaine ABC transporter permease [Candidatus Falkowbacteria bacterium]PTE14668.1 ABC transporter permease [Phaeovulum veldkampii DSM 11550]TDQ53517.1 glycine betaine/proline transport system permease protein [Phaeovulum veldkampii DSM 11550]